MYSYTGNESSLVAIYKGNYEQVYSNIEGVSQLDVQAVLNAKDSYCVNKINENYYMLFSSSYSISNNTVYIVNAYNVDSIFEEKNSSLKNILIIDLVIFCVALIVILILSVFITSAKRKNDFITAFAHELKTPMTAIVGYSDLLRLKKCDQATSKKALKYIYTESKRLESLSHKLMQLMRLSKEKIKFEKIEILEFVEKVTSNIITKNEIELQMEKCEVLANSELLEVVIRNLVENASKSNPKDNKIIIQGSKAKKYKISVIDKGVGIPKNELPKITQDFYMVDKSRDAKSKGSGIGLSLVKRILKLHRTKLVIKSKENEGTIVSFELEVYKK